MSYLSRHTSRGQPATAELAGLVVVLAAGVLTAWWAGQRLGIDLSSLNTAARAIGIAAVPGRPPHEVGYESRIARSQVPSAPFCQAGQQPEFALGVADLKRQLGDTMGNPVECEHPSSASGDTVQRTTTGLAAYRRATNTVTFTDGWRHWALTPRGLVTWEGGQSDPPTG
jgi:hypothetical protein